MPPVTMASVHDRPSATRVAARPHYTPGWPPPAPVPPNGPRAGRRCRLPHRRRGRGRGRADPGIARATLGHKWDLRRPGGQRHLHYRCGNHSGCSNYDGGNQFDDGCREPAPDRRVPDVDLPAVPGGDGHVMAGDSVRLACPRHVQRSSPRTLISNSRPSPTRHPTTPTDCWPTSPPISGPLTLCLARRRARRPWSP